MPRWFLWMFIPLALLCALPGRHPCLAADGIPPADMLAHLEEICFGASPPGSLAERVAELERAIFGSAQVGTLPDRTRSLHQTILVNDSHSPSMVFRLNAVEWAMYHRVTTRPLLEKLSMLEETLLGRVETGAAIDRVEHILAAIWPAGRFAITRIDLTAGTLVKIKLLQRLSSSENAAGDIFEFAVAESVIQDGLVAIPEGSIGRGTITRIVPPKNMGRDAQIAMVFGPIPSLDGSPVRISAGEECITANKSQSLTMRVTTAGVIVLGPAGILSGIFVRGKETLLPEGMTMYVQTTEVTPCFTLG